MGQASGIITMITDFGLRDGYVGSMKGVILGIHPQARVVDISHHIERHDVLHAALMLKHICGDFPTGSVHLVVVDPGVGGERKALVVETEKYYFVGPDNGVLSFVLQEQAPISVVAIENPKYILAHRSDTFHGRDIFAPVAAHCSLGGPVNRFGPGLDTYQTLPVSHPQRTPRGLQGHVIVVDHFGNLVTDISRADLEAVAGHGPLIVQLGDVRIPGISRSYQQVPHGMPLAIWDSWDRLEIALNGGDARQKLGLGRGAMVLVRRDVGE